MKTKVYYLILLFAVLSVFYISSCDKDDPSINIFSIQDDISLGQQMEQEILSNPTEYPLVDSASYPIPYQEVYKVRDDILNSGKIKYKTEFPWKVRIIKNDDVLNAFCTPGGYIYIYTGILKFMQSEDEFAGVLGHEMAHADRRHSTDQLTKQYGLQVLFDIVLGKNQGAISEMTKGLIGLSFSRTAENEADEYSVKYLCPTSFNADGGAKFFQRLIDMDQAGDTPAFLSTHPSPDNRIENFHNQKTSLGCTGIETTSNFDKIKNNLP